MSTRLWEALRKGEFVVTSEIGPPKGIDVEPAMRRLEVFRHRVHAVNVTELQSARMRLGSMAMCNQLRIRGVEPILHVTCRDRNRLAIQSDLLGAWILGIKNVLCLTGDHTRLGDQPQAKPVFDLDSVQLLQLVGTLNAGFDLAGNPLEGRPRFVPGAVFNPTAELLELQLLKTRKKLAAGARFFQTQVVFEPRRLAEFLERLGPTGVPVIAGVVVLKSASMARFMNQKVPGIQVPQILIDELATASPDARQRVAVRICARIMRELRSLCQGVHLMALGQEELIPSVLDEAGL